MAKENQGGVRNGRPVSEEEGAAFDKKKAAKKARSVAKRAAKKEALKKVLAFVKANTDDEAALAAVKLLTPGARFGGVRAAKSDVIVEAFAEHDVIKEDTIWNQFRLGRFEMRRICVNLIKKKAPENRLWISFNPEKGVYALEGTGAEAPEEWTGYTPVDMDDMDI